MENDFDENKVLFVNSKKISIKTRKDYLKKLRNYKMIEEKEKYNTEIYNFNYHDLFVIINEKFEGISPKSISNKLCVLGQYFKWAEDQGLRNNKDYNIDKFIEDVSKTLVAKSNKLRAVDIININELIEVSNSFDIKQSSAILTLLFEGVHGKDCCEIVKLAINDIEGNVLRLATGRKITVSNNTIKILEKANDEKYWLKKSRNGKYTKANFDIKDTIIRKRGQSKSIGKTPFVNLHMDFIKKRFGKKINTHIISDSGKCFHLALIENIRGIKLTTRDYGRVLIRYDCKPTAVAIYYLKHLYLEYRDKYPINVKGKEEYQNIYNELMSYEFDLNFDDTVIENIEGKTEDSREKREKRKGYYIGPDIHLGKEGEKIIQNYLEWKYGNGADIKDESENLIGYDIDLKSNNTSKYECIEVKSTNYIGKRTQFYMTSHEIKISMLENENYYLYIVYFNDSKPNSLFIVQNPLEKLKLLAYFKYFIDFTQTNRDCVVAPLQFRFNADRNKLKIYEDIEFKKFLMSYKYN